MKNKFKRIAFIGQAPPKTMPDRPFGRSALYKWLDSVGITLEILDQCAEFFALIDYFPGVNKSGGHLVPTEEQIKDARPALAKSLLKFNPEIIVPIGVISISEALKNPKINLEEVIGKKFELDPYGIFRKNLIVIPLPHPSGASTWIYKADHKELLNNALELINNELNTHII